MLVNNFIEQNSGAKILMWMAFSGIFCLLNRDQVYGVYLHGSLGLQLCSSSGLMAPDIAVPKIPFTIDQPYHCVIVQLC